MKTTVTKKQTGGKRAGKPAMMLPKRADVKGAIDGTTRSGDGPVLVELAEFQQAIADRSDKLRGQLLQYQIKAVETAVARAPWPETKRKRTGLHDAMVFFFLRGFQRLQDLDDVQRILAARAELVEGNLDLTWFEEWPHRVDSWRGRPVEIEPRAARLTIEQCGRIAVELGLHRNTLLTVAMIAGLIDLADGNDRPLLRAEVVDEMHVQWSRFYEALGDRAVEAERQAGKQLAKPRAPARRITWTDLVGEGGNE